MSDLPLNLTNIEHQVAGHNLGSKTKLGQIILDTQFFYIYIYIDHELFNLGFLKSDNGLLLKPIQAPPRGDREHNFYKKIFQTPDLDELNNDEKELKNLIPKYHGLHINDDSI